jgi:Raf kinase inhibitor-like YbhB/YbcL family protein
MEGIMLKKISSLVALTLAIALPVYADDASNGFNVSSSATLDRGPLPSQYTCDGKDISPQLSWHHQPANTQSYAVIVSDPDAPSGTFYHWVLFNIPKSVTSLDEGIARFPSGTLVGKNSFGNQGYNGPCPPKDAAHTYVFTLYALDASLSLPAGSDAETVISVMKDHVLSQAQFTAIYSRGMKQ